MTNDQPDDRTDQGASVILLKAESVLMVKRRKPPLAGLWSFPGGRLKISETPEQGAMRELCEETGLVAPALQLVGLHRIEQPAGLLTLHVFTGAWQVGTPTAGDDADAVQFFRFDEIPGLQATPEAASWLQRALALVE